MEEENVTLKVRVWRRPMALLEAANILRVNPTLLAGIWRVIIALTMSICVAGTMP
jgi:hypothetical protein